jgi:DNA-directed RNA polymerase subunit RPC12/RpoP
VGLTCVIGVCNTALSDSGLQRSKKVFFAESKVKFGEALGVSMKEQKEAKNELQKVKKDTELDLNKKFPCEYCPKKFRKNDTLAKHIILLHSTTQLCTRCNKEFNNKITLKTHQESCSYRCSSCDKTFKNKRNLLEHMKVNSGIASK